MSVCMCVCLCNHDPAKTKYCSWIFIREIYFHYSDLENKAISSPIYD